MKKIKLYKEKKKKNKDLEILKLKRNMLDLLKLKKRKELMKWQIVKEDKENLWI